MFCPFIWPAQDHSPYQEVFLVSIKELLKSNANSDNQKRGILKRALAANDCTQYFVLHNKSSKYDVCHF